MELCPLCLAKSNKPRSAKILQLPYLNFTYASHIAERFAEREMITEKFHENSTVYVMNAPIARECVKGSLFVVLCAKFIAFQLQFISFNKTVKGISKHLQPAYV